MESTGISEGGIKKTFKPRFVEIRKHLRTCVQEHGDRCNTPVVLSDPSFEIFLIDIQKMCLVKKPIAECGYIALSYVWGGVKQYQHTKERTVSLLKENSLQEIIDQIPRTIRDSIDMIRELRGFFLWVDALCIVQDDAETKHINIARMADIYRSAFLTIAAADAVDANSRLPCNYPYELTLSVLQTAQGERLPLSSALRSTKYVSRAWTFQERGSSINGWSPRSDSTTHEHILSTEIDILDYPSHIQTHRKEIQSEFTPSLRRLPFSRWMLKAEHPDEEERCLLRCNNTTASWALITMLYSEKLLSFSSDVSNAFSGIAERLEEMTGGNLIHGIPTTLLPHALLWAIFLPSWQIERRESSTPLPSWSWMAWDGPVEFPLYMQEAMISAVRGGPRLENFYSSIFSPKVLFSDDKWWLSPSSSPGPKEPLGPSVEEWSHSSGGLLKFVSFTVPLSYSQLRYYARESLNYEPRVKVYLLSDSSSHLFISHIDQMTANPDGILLGVNHDDLWEYCVKTVVELVLITESENEGGIFVNFLLVHWLNGYAERLGIGQAHASAWKSWSPEPKTIILG